MIIILPDAIYAVTLMTSGETAQSLRNDEALVYSQFLSITRESSLLFSRVYLGQILPNHPATWHLAAPSSGSSSAQTKALTASNCKKLRSPSSPRTKYLYLLFSSWTESDSLTRPAGGNRCRLAELPGS